MEHIMNASSRVCFCAAAVFAAIAASFVGVIHAADTGKIVVQVDQPGAKISPTLFGLMTEEINFSYDGGLYAELIQNRIFKNPRRGQSTGAIPHWEVLNSEGAQGEIALDTNDPVNTTALTTSLKLDITSVGDGQRVGVANDGFWGIPARPNTTYQASF